MSDTLKNYTSDVDLLLMEVCMAGAMYGLERHVALIVDHLVTLPRTQGVALLAHALAKTVVRDYDAALALTERVLQDAQWKHLHGEAAAFGQLATQLKLGQTVQPLSVDRATA
jgi:hypothetical protein